MVRINGEESAADGMTAAEYLQTQQLSRDRVAVMINGEILPKSEYDTAVLKDGDELDVIGFVGGG